MVALAWKWCRRLAQRDKDVMQFPSSPIPPLHSGSPSVAAGGASKPAGAPPDWRAPHVELNATAASAASVADAWGVRFQPANAGERTVESCLPSGRVWPVVVCAPLRVCALELEPGEHIQSPPQIGDGRRWEVTPVTSGSGLKANGVARHQAN